MSEELILTLAQKDADFLEKVVRKILSAATTHWETEASNELAKNCLAPTSEYTNAFNQWHLLRQCLLSMETELASAPELSPGWEYPLND